MHLTNATKRKKSMLKELFGSFDTLSFLIRVIRDEPLESDGGGGGGENTKKKFVQAKMPEKKFLQEIKESL